MTSAQGEEFGRHGGHLGICPGFPGKKNLGSLDDGDGEGEHAPMCVCKCLTFIREGRVGHMLTYVLMCA